MRALFFLLALMMIGGVCSGKALAQRDTSLDYRSTHIAQPQYEAMARLALSEKPNYFDFMQFRVLYSRTRQYDPFATETLKGLADLSYVVLNAEGGEQAKTALFAYQSIVSDHLANLAIVIKALSLSKQDRRFGNPAFFEWLKVGIIKSILISGDGLTYDGAYDVITFDEETLLFQELNLQPLSTDSVKEGFRFYNMHEVGDLQTGRQRTLFVNTAIIMKYLEAIDKQERKELTIDIRRQ